MYEYDLNIKWKGTKPKENTDAIKQLLKLGWSNCAWNTQVFGKLGSKSAKQSTNICLDIAETRECLRSRGILKLDTNEVGQYSRVTITVDDVVDCQAITAANETLRGYDIVAVCPGNAAVFAYLCKTAQVDIICIDFTRHLAFPLIKKLLDVAVERGVHFEILYSPLLAVSSSRKEVLAGTRILVQFLRGRHIILSSGAESAADIRGPFDVINMGQLLNLTAEQARLAITKNCEAVLSHGKARKLKSIPLEVMSVAEAQQRWPKHSNAKQQQAKRGREALMEGAECAERQEGNHVVAAPSDKKQKLDASAIHHSATGGTGKNDEDDEDSDARDEDDSIRLQDGEDNGDFIKF